MSGPPHLTRHEATISAAIALAIGAATVAACAGGGTPDGDGPWAAAAESQLEGMTESMNAGPDYDVAKHFAASGSVDLRMVGGPIATTAEEMASVADLLLAAPGGDRAEVLLDDAYVSADGAIGSYRRIFYDDDGVPDYSVAWAAAYAIDGSRITARFYSYREIGATAWNPFIVEGEALYERYLDAWAEPDEASVGAVYADDAVVVDSLSGDVWNGVDEIARGIAEDAPLDRGPWPHVWHLDLDGWRELAAIVQPTGRCPMREARRWVLRGDRIVEDLRYRHIDSVRRCALDLGDGWWSSFDPPPGDRGVSNLKMSLEGEVVELINAEPEQIELMRWSFERFASVLDPPDAAVIWFPPSLDCPGKGSFARRQDERHEGGHSVTFCLDDAHLLDPRLRPRWARDAARLALHELAHVWMYDHLTDDLRDEFLDVIGIEAWRGDDLEWDERGVEHAAETIAWGLSGPEYAIYDIEPRPPCDQLTAQFELLTGRSPLTSCVGGEQP